jgi:hypothetical protein
VPQWLAPSILDLKEIGGGTDPDSIPDPAVRESVANEQRSGREPLMQPCG